MRQRKGETKSEYRARRAAYDAAREGDRHFSVRSRTLDAEGNIKSITEVRRGRKLDKVARIVPRRLARTSTLLDREGRVAAQWLIERPEERERYLVWKEIAAGFAEDLPRVTPSSPPNFFMNPDLLIEYPVGDHHMGMLAWKQDALESYDLDISERLLSQAFTYLTSVVPKAPKGVIEFLGDFLHYDSAIPMTPTNKNMLDADGRFPKMVRAGIRAMRRSIEIALDLHAQVHVIVEIGNHDLYSSVFLMECLANVYEHEPRVTVDTSPRHYHYFVHDRCLVGTHHGHGTKPEQLPGIMAADRPKAWGASEYRYWRTGHIHTKYHWDFPGCSVESFRVLPPPDAWAHQKGFRPHRSMNAIVLHNQFGEIARYPVTPHMLEQL